jgi:hypothetical protein
MPGYKSTFEDIASGHILFVNRDILYRFYVKFCTLIMSSSIYFFLTASIYIGLTFITYEKILKKEMYAVFLFTVTSFSFFSYGTNTIRAGMAASILLLGVSLLYKQKKIVPVILLLIAIGIHKSFLFPAIALCLSYLYKHTNFYILFWFICIIFSFIIGSQIEGYTMSLGFEDERMSSYLQKNKHDIGGIFRWDFFIYGTIPIIWGLYILTKKKLVDNFYTSIFNAYIFVNAIWILVIRMAFTDRFAYLSWIFIPIIIIYPLIKYSEAFKKRDLAITISFLLNISLTLYLYYK